MAYVEHASLRGYHRIDYQLSHQQKCYGYEGAQKPEHHHRRGKSAVRLPDKL
jgi:hypothetical protein